MKKLLVCLLLVVLAFPLFAGGGQEVAKKIMICLTINLSCATKRPQLMIIHQVTGAIETNCYLIYDNKTMEAALVDAGRIQTTATEVAGKIDAATLRTVHAQIETDSALGKIVLEGF